jgi:hypothetical protein
MHLDLIAPPQQFNIESEMGVIMKSINSMIKREIGKNETIKNKESDL